MTSNDRDESDDEKLFRSAATDGQWPNVFKMYEEKRELRMVKIQSTGDTVLHMAVSSGKLYVVRRIVDLVCPKRSNEQVVDENGDEKKNVFGAENDKGNTPLHLAASASNGSVEMCEKIGDADPSIITRRNKDGETPLFLAAQHGNKEAFLLLRYNIPEGSSSSLEPYKRNDENTILHCAIAGGHIDLGIEIVDCYKEHIKYMMMTRNEKGLSPLHVLAETPSFFESTDLPRRFFVVRLLYFLFKFRLLDHWLFSERKCKPFIDALVKFRSNACAEGLPCCIENIWLLIVSPLRILAAAVLVVLLLIISPANWFHAIRKMKENHADSLKLLERLLPHASNEDKSEITSGRPFQPPSTSSETIEDNEAGSKIIDSPLRIAAKNGVIEMVQKILQFFPHGIEVLDDEEKNIVLLAAEKRQTKLYQFLRDYHKDNSAFRRVDKDGNTALHLAAKPGINLYGQTTTMIEEFKWFEFVKSSVPSGWDRYNKEGKTAGEIFRDSYKKHMARDRKWLNQTSQTCCVASTLVASMAFSNFAGENIKKKNDLSLVALSLSLTSTISFLAILAFRSQSRNFWKYVPFMLHIAILTMFGSIVALWISLFHGQSKTACAILGFPIAILSIVSLPIFIGPTVMSMFNPVPPPNRNTTNAIQYRRPQKKENGVDKEQKTTPNPTFRATDPIQDTAGSPDDTFTWQKDEGGSASLTSDILEWKPNSKMHKQAQQHSLY